MTDKRTAADLQKEWHETAHSHPDCPERVRRELQGSPPAIGANQPEPLAGQATVTAGPKKNEPADELARFIFDPDAPVQPEARIYAGFLSKSDLVVWPGKEKHRKTNLLLQLAICTATGRNFLNFRFVADSPQKVVCVDYESKTEKLKVRYDAIMIALNLSQQEKKLLKKNLRIVEVRRLYKAGKRFPRFPIKVGLETEASKFPLQGPAVGGRGERCARHGADVRAFEE